MANQNPPLEPAPVATGKLDPFFFKSLPVYFKENDSYKNVDNEGLLERYLNSLQTINEQFVTDVDNLASQIFPKTAGYKFLDYIAAQYGYPPDTFGYDDIFSLLLENITILNKSKGTIHGLTNYFKLLGVTITVTIFPRETYYHDVDEVLHDEVTFHDSACYLCTRYAINIEDVSTAMSQHFELPLTDNEKRAIQSMFLYFLPLNMVMTDFQYNGVTQDIRLLVNLILMDWGAGTGSGFIIGHDTADVGHDTSVIGVD